MDINIIEKMLVAWFASQLNLTVDTDIFRGGVPSMVDDGVGVLLNSDITGNIPELNKYNCQLIGKYTNRDTAMSLHATAAELAPRYGLTAEVAEVSITARALLKRGSGGVWRQVDDGKVKHYFSLNFVVVFSQS